MPRNELPDVVVLDLGLPDMDGFQVLGQIRDWSDVPVVIHTVRDEETDRIRGLEQGADDYMVKPFSPGELVTRLKALIRRSRMRGISEEHNVKLDKSSTKGKLNIDFDSEMVSIDGRLVDLSPREYKLLYHLVINKGALVSNEVLMENVFPESGNGLQFLIVYMKKLRERLEDNPDNPHLIIYEQGKGYRYVGS